MNWRSRRPLRSDAVGITSHRRAGLILSLVGLLVLTGCSGNSVDGSTAADTGPIRIGAIWPQSGPYKAIGDDQAKGWQLYLDSHGGKLGGRDVTVTTADEAEGKQSAQNGFKKLVDKDHAMVLVGTGSADAVESIQAQVTERKVPFIGTGGRPSTLKDVTWIWHSSWLSRETGQAIADYVRTTVAGPVYVIGPDYQGGYDNIGGFVDPFTALGGKLANKDGKPKWVPWPATTNFLPYFNEIPADTKAVYTFYAGKPGIDFVTQYAQAGLQGKIPLYAAGFLTEGAPTLTAEGPAANGIKTVLNYASNLDNDANRAFATAYQQKHGTAPNLYSVTGWDAAQLLDLAIAAAGPNPSSTSINEAIGKLGAINSPRGSWRFSSTTHTPIQPWYLREVQSDGRASNNVVVQNLTILGS